MHHEEYEHTMGQGGFEVVKVGIGPAKGFGCGLMLVRRV